jgi:A/G-specific adenine glycosylase
LYTGSTAAPTLRRRLLRWYDRSARDLPWRQTRDPYAVLVSEVMLQQTQVSRVLPAYRAFLRRFPTLAALSRAALGDVLRAWSGLGYNRRARDLHRIARLHSQELPATREALDALPGVGAYTAGAVSCFSRGESVAFADTNIRRVLGRALLGRIATEREAVALDERLVPRRGADRWHHALMDLGATVCLARAPRCDVCPIARDCRSRGRVVHAAPRRQAAFATSDRRVRGRIIALLAERGDLTARTLERAIGDSRARRIASVLEREGLIERAGDIVRLPS